MKTSSELEEDFFRGRSVDIAQDLLGKLIAVENLAGRIVETEAYLGEKDPSCHLARNNEKRNRVFRKGAGTVYVFKIYQHHNMNFITEIDGYPEGVLIRAIEPVNGLEEMKDRREVEKDVLLGSGPGRLTQALGINREKDNGLSLTESRINLYSDGSDPDIEVSRRIGISEAEEWPLRFSISGNKHVSKPLDKDVNEGFEPKKFYNNIFSKK